MISVVIRNKNEAQYLERVLKILRSEYTTEIQEIIVVDNNSKDTSLEVAQKYDCKVVFIDKFTYGKAINIGIDAAVNPYILLLSAHAIPIGKNFFKNTLQNIADNQNTAGIRFINSIENYERAIENQFEVRQPLQFGLMAACCVIVKSVWENHKFDENLGFSEDKEWSQRVFNAGFKILEQNETFFYFIKRTNQSSLSRYKNETIAEYKLFSKKFQSPMKILLLFLKKIVIINVLSFFKVFINDCKMVIAKIQIYNTLKKNR